MPGAFNTEDDQWFALDFATCAPRERDYMIKEVVRLGLVRRIGFELRSEYLSSCRGVCAPIHPPHRSFSS